jgi:hypothetical protein
MTLAERLIAVFEGAEENPEWQAFDTRTLRAAAAFVAELRREGK